MGCDSPNRENIRNHGEKSEAVSPPWERFKHRFKSSNPGHVELHELNKRVGKGRRKVTEWS